MIPKYLDYIVTPADLRNMPEENVMELMIFTDRDRKKMRTQKNYIGGAYKKSIFEWI